MIRVQSKCGSTSVPRLTYGWNIIPFHCFPSHNKRTMLSKFNNGFTCWRIELLATHMFALRSYINWIHRNVFYMVNMFNDNSISSDFIFLCFFVLLKIEYFSWFYWNLQEKHTIFFLMKSLINVKLKQKPFSMRQCKLGLRAEVYCWWLILYAHP